MTRRPIRGRLPRPGAELGRYVIERLLGSGGMGVVYVARDPELDRPVALKVLRHRSKARARLLREAQAMARLNHPNVVTVYDVGEHEGCVFVAMELLRGPILREWQAGRAHEEVIAAYVQAGRGLTAAHAAGLVHRDFKPENVIVTDDGRVVVLDFGIARFGVDTASRDEPGAGPSPVLSAAATQDGAVVGTPAYMAPERLSGVAADSRADQFSFCAALYEALYGELPYAGDDAPSRAYGLLYEELRDPPSDSDVPGRVREALVRGLARRPEERFDSMKTLLSALSDKRTWRRRALVLSVAAGVLAVGWGATEIRAAAARANCNALGSQMAQTWGDAQRQAGRDRYAEFGQSWGSRTWALAEERIDAYAASWVDVHRQVCERVPGGTSAATRCLEQRRELVGGLAKLLVSAGPGLGEGADMAAASLPPVEECLEPEARDGREAELVLLLTRGDLLWRMGEEEAALGSCGLWLMLRRPTGWNPSPRRRMWISLRSSRARGRLADSMEASWRGYELATRAGRDDIALQAAIGMVYAQGGSGDTVDDALRWAAIAKALLERTGAVESLMEAHYRRAEGVVQMSLSEFDAALSAFERAYELERRLAGEDHPRAADTLGQIAVALGRKRRFKESIATREQALATLRAARGAEHPWTIGHVVNLATAYQDAGRYDDALATLDEAESIRLRSGRVRPGDAARIRIARGVVFIALDRPQEALDELLAGLAAYTEIYGGESTSVAEIQVDIGLAYSRLGRHEEALDHYYGALAVLQRTGGEGQQSTITVRINIAGALTKLGREEEALAVYEAALEAAQPLSDRGYIAGVIVTNIAGLHNRAGRYEDGLRLATDALETKRRLLGESHPSVAHAWDAIGHARLGLGRDEEAADAFQRADAIFTSTSPRLGARKRFARANLLWGMPGGQQAARAEAKAALALLADVDAGGLDERIRTWLAER